jgi:hypothetical protein
MTEVFQFEPITPCEWQGRYRHPNSKESVYHVGVDNRIEVQWREGRDKFDCPVEPTPAAHALAKAANAIKTREAGRAGGAFVINEFGQVICPIQNSRQRFLIGQARGRLRFIDPSDGESLISIGDDDKLMCGDEWNRPYIGMQFQLHAGSFIYFWHEDDEGGGKVRPPCQDSQLIEKFRAIRSYGAVRFIVNHHGIVLTKALVEDKGWRPLYIGRINYKHWFEREE